MHYSEVHEILLKKSGILLNFDNLVPHKSEIDGSIYTHTLWIISCTGIYIPGIYHTCQKCAFESGRPLPPPLSFLSSFSFYVLALVYNAATRTCRHKLSDATPVTD